MAEARGINGHSLVGSFALEEKLSKIQKNETTYFFYDCSGLVSSVVKEVRH
jgi:hypothetical protein